MRTVSSAVGAVMMVCLASPGWASATLESSKTGAAYQSNRGMSVLKVGDRVGDNTRIVVAGGQGDTVLRYDDGCEVRLNPGEVHTVLNLSPCGAAPVAPVEASLGLGLSAPVVVGGIAVVGIVAGVAVAASGKSSSNPPVYISP